MLRLSIALLLPAALTWGQTTPNSITVTASKNANVQPDQVVFGISVNTGLSASRDEVVAALQEAGVTGTSFNNVGSVQQFDRMGARAEMTLNWGFTVTAPISNMKSVIDQLTSAQRKVAQGKTGFSVSFGVQGTQVSAQAQQSQACSMTELIADARAQALKLSAAAGMGLGTILAISGGTFGPDPSGVGLFAAPVFYPVCSLTVKFALGAF